MVQLHNDIYQIAHDFCHTTHCFEAEITNENIFIMCKTTCLLLVFSVLVKNTKKDTKKK